MIQTSNLNQTNRNERILSFLFSILSGFILIFSLYQFFLSSENNESLLLIILLSFTFIFSLINLFTTNNELMSFIPLLIQLAYLIKSLNIYTQFSFLLTYLGIAVAILLILYIQPKRTFLYLGSSFALFTISFYNNYQNVNILQNSKDILTIIFLISSLTILLVLSILHLNKFNDYSITIKIITTSIVIVFIPIIFIVTVINRSNQQIIEQTFQSVLSSEAQVASTTLEQFIDSTIKSLETEANIPAFRSFLLSQTSNNRSIAKSTLSALAAKNPGQIISYGVLDTDGTVILDNIFANEGQDESESLYFKEVILNKNSYISDIYFPNEPEENPSIYFSTPIKSQTGQIIGVLRLRYNANQIQQIMLEHDSKSKSNDNYSVVLQDLPNNYLQIAETRDLQNLYTTIVEPSSEDKKNYQVNGLLPIYKDINQVSINSPELYTAVITTINDEVPVFNIQSNVDQSSYYGYIIRIESHPTWTLIRYKTNDVILSGIAQQTKNTQLYFIFIVSITILLSWIFGSLLTRSIQQLTNNVLAARKGDLKTLAVVDRSDEVGVLSESFNYFISELNETISNLETTIQDRTKELSSQVERLKTASEIGQISTSANNLNELLNAIVFKVSEDYGYYHVGIFLLDDSGEYAELRSTNSEGGWKMLARKHRLKVGKEGVVGNAIATGNEKIVQKNIEEDLTHFFNPDLPNTKSEIALPLIVNNIILGALDVQSLKENAFTDTDISVFNVLANQISLAINNINLLNDLKESLETERRILGDQTEDVWKKEISMQNLFGYRSTESGTYALSFSEINKNPDSIKNIEDEYIFDEKGNLIIPIMIRGKKIGILEIKNSNKTKNKNWSTPEINVLLKTVEQLGITLDNARLFERSQKISLRERLTTDISTKIWSSTDVESILQTTLEEIGKALNISQGSIQIDLTDSANDSTRGLIKE